MKTIISLILVLFLTIAATGCASGKLDASGGNVPGGASDQPGTKSPSDAAVNGDLNAANQQFSWELFKKLNSEDSGKDLFISPLSISGMLMMALNGAGSTTRDAMEGTLHYGGITPEALNRGYAYLFGRIANLDKKVTVRIANSIWARNGFEVKKEFMDINRNYLSAEAQSLDFSDPKSADVINNWISQRTNGLIPKMIDPPIPGDVMMYLVNAIYFKGSWAEAFKAENTQTADFFALDGKTDTVSMMHRTGNIDYFKDDKIQAVRLPYGNGSFSMVIAMPAGDVNQWIAQMNRENWNRLMESFAPVSDLQLGIPKFKMEYGTKELNQTLSDLGMGIAFSESADFSGIADNLYISKVLHKAVIDVNEEGTEAAGATTGEMTLTAIREPVVFTADHPFVFAIVDNQEGNILFMGKKINGDR